MQWIASGIVGAHGVVVQGLVVQAHRRVPGPKMDHLMAELAAQDTVKIADHATHKAATVGERTL